ncbi:hypothetical protein [Nocardioides insulae]|uniref:hypothetical protein n=1 Tax=Nocardioides insulae TaxID=394734 RepID=UPI000419F2E2|nr:hypothetical protein [Nocardioides insulae]
MKRLLAAVVLIGVVAAVAVAAWRQLGGQPTVPRSQTCTAVVGDLAARLDLDQSGNAALIVALSVRRGLPARAGTIALATAMQESKLYNIDYGDRDSLGLFQQRPSQGWGTPAQVRDPVHATERFYDGLVTVGGYESMPITDAAQAVQRSAYPEAYAQHESAARALASALSGQSPRALTCELDPPAEGHPAEVRRDLETAFGATIGTPVVRGRSVTAAVGTPDHGWAMAHYLIARAERLGISRVAYHGWAWSAADSPEGWVRTEDTVRGRLSATVAGPAPSA